MAAQWPSTLQQYLDGDSFTYSIGNTLTTTEMDIGTPKVRRRFTKSVDNYAVTIRADSTQLNTFLNFYNSTLAGGSLPFEFLDPITGALRNFRIQPTPNTRHIGAGNWRVAMTWIRLPQ